MPFLRISPLFTDLYQLTMGQAYFEKGIHQSRAAFDYFYRKLPFSGGYVISAGLGELLDQLVQLHFTDEELEFLAREGFSDAYLDYLSGFSFQGDIYGVREGEIVFPFAPVLRIEGGLLETQLIETLLLNVMNFQSLIATKASRIRQSAGDRVLSDFGLRRAQGMGAMAASRAAAIGGFDSTSNMEAARHYGLNAAGTMGHSFIESFDSEKEAFQHYARCFPDRSTLLVDTYSTLKSGLPNAIAVAREMEEEGKRLQAIRLDSGDLAYLSKKVRKALDEAGFSYVKIVVSNQLDEYVIKSLLDQQAPIDVFGVGTSMVIGRPDAALDGVFKLAESGGKPRFKLSENYQKTSLPGRKRILRFTDHEGFFYADCVALMGEDKPARMIHPFDKEKSLNLEPYAAEELFVQHMAEGKRLQPAETLENIRTFASGRLARLPDEHKRFDYPHIYKLGISESLFALRQQMIEKYSHYL